MYGDADLGPARFDDLVRPDKPNQFLVCPVSYCKLTVPDQMSKAYPVAPDTLLSTLKEMVSGMGTARIINDPEPDGFRFVDRTSFFKFPDTISIDVVSGESGTSMVAVFSRSQIGYSDLGVNKKRVESLLTALDKKLADLD